MTFKEFLLKTKSNVTGWYPQPVVIALDPGETTGYAVFVAAELVEAGQLDTHRLPYCIPLLTDLFARVYNKYNLEPVIVYEAYKVYSWKAETHSWDTLHTPRLIGCIQTLAFLNRYKTHDQMAQQPKQFVTDDKLKLWGMYKSGQKHARDAIRHGTYFMLFNQDKPK